MLHETRLSSSFLSVPFRSFFHFFLLTLSTLGAQYITKQYEEYGEGYSTELHSFSQLRAVRMKHTEKPYIQLFLFLPHFLLDLFPRYFASAFNPWRTQPFTERCYVDFVPLRTRSYSFATHATHIFSAFLFPYHFFNCWRCCRTRLLQQLAHGGVDAYTGGVTKRYVAQLEFMEPRFPDVRNNCSTAFTPFEHIYTACSSPTGHEELSAVCLRVIWVASTPFG